MQIKSRFTFHVALVDHTHRGISRKKSRNIRPEWSAEFSRNVRISGNKRDGTLERDEDESESGRQATTRRIVNLNLERRMCSRERARTWARPFPLLLGFPLPPIPPYSTYILPLFRPLLSCRRGLRSTSPPSKHRHAKRENSKKRPDFLRPVPGSLIRELDLNFRTRWVLSRKSCFDFQVDLARPTSFRRLSQ